jgi:hypothetical protein
LGASRGDSGVQHNLNERGGWAYVELFSKKCNIIFKCLLNSGVYESKIFHRLLYFSHERANVIHICAYHFLDNCSFIEDVIAMHDTYKFIRKMDDIQFSTSCPLPWRRHDSSRWSDVSSPICWTWCCDF